MKCIRQILILVLVAASLVGLRAQVPTNGLVAYYPFNGDAIDGSGNSFVGIVSGAVPTTDRFGNANGALLFDGVSANVNLGNPPAFNFQDSFTIAAWVKLTGNQVNKYIIAKYDFGNSTHNYGLGTAGNSQPYAFVMGDGPGYNDIPGAGNLNDGSWHALAFVYDSNVGITLYLDNVVSGKASAPLVGIFTNSVPLIVGATFSAGQNFAGAIDDVRLYNRALTAAEVTSLGPTPQITITQQPHSYYLAAGGSVNMRVTATVTGTAATPSYIWYDNDVAIAGATGSNVTIQSNNAGTHTIKVKVSAGDVSQVSDPATLVFTLPGSAQLLAHYTFEQDSGNTVVDETGNFPATSTGATYGPGRVGNRAMKFDGRSTSVHIPYPASDLDLAGVPYTIAFWMRPEVQATEAVIWMNDGADEFGGYSFNFTSAQMSWAHNSGLDNPITGAFRPLTNWVHLALVWNGASRQIYTNGVLQTSVTTRGSIVSERDDDLYLGSKLGSTLFFKGALDDVRIYNYALATDEITQLATAPIPESLSIQARATDMLLTWPFVDASTLYRVEIATTLTPPADWTPVAGAPTRSGDTYSMPQVIPTAPRFYRLRKL